MGIFAVIIFCEFVALSLHAHAASCHLFAGFGHWGFCRRNHINCLNETFFFSLFSFFYVADYLTAKSKSPVT